MLPDIGLEAWDIPVKAGLFPESLRSCFLLGYPRYTKSSKYLWRNKSAEALSVYSLQCWFSKFIMHWNHLESLTQKACGEATMLADDD